MRMKYAMHVIGKSSESVVIYCNVILTKGNIVVVYEKTYFVFEAYDTTIDVLPVQSTIYCEKEM